MEKDLGLLESLLSIDYLFRNIQSTQITNETDENKSTKILKTCFSIPQMDFYTWLSWKSKWSSVNVKNSSLFDFWSDHVLVSDIPSITYLYITQFGIAKSVLWYLILCVRMSSWLAWMHPWSRTLSLSGITLKWIIIFYWLVPEIYTAFNLEANWFQLYQGAHELTDIIK